MSKHNHLTLQDMSNSNIWTSSVNWGNGYEQDLAVYVSRTSLGRGVNAADYKMVESDINCTCVWTNRVWVAVKCSLSKINVYLKIWIKILKVSCWVYFIVSLLHQMIKYSQGITATAPQQQHFFTFLLQCQHRYSSGLKQCQHGILIILLRGHFHA